VETRGRLGIGTNWCVSTCVGVGEGVDVGVGVWVCACVYGGGGGCLGEDEGGGVV